MSAESAALGISIIAPTSIFSSKGMPSARSSARHSSSMALARRTSSTPEIIGYIIRTLPTALARRIARSCVLKTSSRSRQKRMARQPRKGLISSGRFSAVMDLSPPRSSVRMMTRVRQHALRDLAVGLVLVLLGRELGAIEVEELGAIKPDAFRAALRT